MTTNNLTTRDNGTYTAYLWGGVPTGLEHDARGWWGVTMFAECYPTANAALAAMQEHWQKHAKGYKRRCRGSEYALARALTYEVMATLFPQEVKA